MAYVGGDILEVRLKHPEGDAVLRPKSNEDNMMDLGGYRNNDEANSITTTGEIILSKNYVRGFIELTVANDQNTRKEMVTINKIAASVLEAEVNVTMINKSIWSGTGQVVGDLQENTNKATFKIKIAVSKMEKQ